MHMPVLLNTIFSVAIIGFCLWRVGWRHCEHNCLEQLSLGFIAAGMLFATLNELTGREPFDLIGLTMARCAWGAFLFAIFGTRCWWPVDQGKSCLQLIRDARL